MNNTPDSPAKPPDDCTYQGGNYWTLFNRGRDGHYWAPPAQIRTCGLPAYGSYLGCLTAKRTFGQGCRIRGLGSHSSASWAIRSHVVRSFWLRRRSVRPHKTLTWCRKAASARLLVGTAW